MLSNRKKKKQKVVDTIFSEGTVIEGKVNHSTSLRVDGKVYGEIICEGDVHIGKSGYVETGIQANNIIISGEVNGDVQAVEKVHVQPSGKLTGSVTTTGIIIDDGGVFNGESIISSGDKKVAKESKPTKHIAEQAIQEKS